MPDPYVRELGRVQDIDGIPVTVGAVINAREAELVASRG
jgi:hypothetical protein